MVLGGAGLGPYLLGILARRFNKARQLQSGV